MGSGFMHLTFSCVLLQITRAGAVGLAQVASSKPHLKLIALDENSISEAGIKRVKVGYTLVLMCMVKEARLHVK
jgi:hypothetical protein